MRQLARIALTTLLLLAYMGTAGAQTNAHTQRTVVALAPLTSIGGLSTASFPALAKLLESSISSIPDFKIITSKASTRAARAAKRPDLRTCDGDIPCLTALGNLVSANLVVFAEVSDLGTSHVLYLEVIDVASGAELRSATLELSGTVDKKLASRAATTRLLAPARYTGEIEVRSNVTGVAVFVDGHKLDTKSALVVQVAVGSHALRVTHPEHSDLVRFVDVRFGERTLIDAPLRPLPGLRRKLAAKGTLGTATADAAADAAATKNIVIRRIERPWYFRWQAIAGATTAVALTTAILFATAPAPLRYDNARDL